VRAGRVDITAPPYVHRSTRPRTYRIQTFARPDPTLTGRIRERFVAELRRRFARLLAAITEQIEKENALGGQPIAIKVMADGSGFGADSFDHEGRFLFPRSADAAAEFMRWLRRQARKDILSITEGAAIGSSSRTAWSNVYIDTAYQRGIRQAGGNLKRGGAKVADTWMRSAFNRPIHADRLGLLYSRTFTELYDVTEVMARQLRDTLTLGMAQGRNPIDIARDVRDRVEKVGFARAKLIARTEIISAHAEATLNAYEEAGVEGVEVEAEWSTAGDDRVCEECAGMEGRVFTLADARGMIPAHPNCRCAFLPKVIGGSGITLNWSRIAPRNHQAERRRGNPPRAVPRPHAHGSACGHHRGRGAEPETGTG
jgi:SPP1 gp7 family putative phage head morphogenesis protein